MVAMLVHLLAEADARIEFPSVDFFTIAPELALFVTALVILLVRSWVRRGDLLGVATAVSFVGLTVAGVLTWWQWQIIDEDGKYQALRGMVAMDGFAVFSRVVVLGATALAILVALGYLRREQLEAPEYLSLMLLSATGMMIMAAANDLIAIFVALEVLSIALYVLAAFDRRRLESQEAGLKYFVLGAFSSAVFLYGVALTYGATGTTNLTKMFTFLGGTGVADKNGLLLLGIAMLLVGFAFKIAAVPFHMWTPDVYEGSPTPVTAFMAAATKMAAFAALVRVFVGAFQLQIDDWRPAISALAILSLLVGTTAAIVQTDVKRMLAYSSISHAGYALIGVAAARDGGIRAVLFYLFVYALMAVGSFAVVTVLAGRGDAGHSLASYRGLATRDPRMAAVFTFLLLSQAGVPLTGGFVAKLVVFQAAVTAGQQWLALVGMFCAVIGAFVYLRIVVTMWAGTDDDAVAPETAPGGRLRVGLATGLALFVCVAGLIGTGVLPGKLLDFAGYAHLLF